MVDIRYEDQVTKAMEEGAKKFGGIDILINNAGIMNLVDTGNELNDRSEQMQEIESITIHLLESYTTSFHNLKKVKMLYW